MSENAKRIVASVSASKNIQMVIYHNILPNGKKDSITRFEPLNSNKDVYKRTFPKAPRQ